MKANPSFALMEKEPVLATPGLDDLLRDCAPEWFKDYLQLPHATRATIFREELEKAQRQNGRIVSLQEDGATLGVAGFQKLEWDSAHFQISSARVNPVCLKSELSRAERSATLTRLLEWAVATARAEGVELLQRRLLSSRMDEINILESLGFHMVDNIVTLTKDLAAEPETSVGAISFGAPEAAEHDALIEMTWGAFPFSRFVNEPLLDPVKGEGVYVRWLEGVLQPATASGGKASDLRLTVCRWNGTAAGYVGWRFDDRLPTVRGRRIALLDLFLVAPRFRGKGLGRAMLRHAELQAVKAGAGVMEASTWLNERAAMATYQGCGYRVREQLLTYHCRLTASKGKGG